MVLPQIKASSQTTLLVKEKRYNICLFLNKGFQFSAHPVITKTSKPHPAWQPGSPHPLHTKQSASHTACLVTLFPNVIHVGAYGVLCPPAPDCEYMGLRNCCSSHLASVGCCVVGHPHHPIVAALSYQQCE